MRPDLTEEILPALMTWLSAVREYSGRVAKAAGIGVTDLEALHELAQEGPMSSGLLARRLCVTTGAITHLVDRLQDADLVRRVPDPADRRRVLVEISPEAAERIRCDYRPLVDAVRGTLSALDVTEQQSVLRFLTAGTADVRTLR
ncbi:MarR family transcriptional regulator [Georgenia sp. 10Sc9-8]|uniref:MarR family transcriptional regulator n=1 Tax=Georgenia halotolerans TaxID=3028317 RepID=A0ABT5U2Y2_9MICO|nr:MarR family transcriptional regulator [Georgenia halotolerans]